MNDKNESSKKEGLSLALRILIVLSFCRMVILVNCELIKKFVHRYFKDNKDNLKKYQKTLISIRILLGIKLITVTIVEMNKREYQLFRFLLYFNIIHYLFLRKISSYCFGAILKATMDQQGSGSGSRISSKVLINIKAE